MDIFYQNNNNQLDDEDWPVNHLQEPPPYFCISFKRHQWQGQNKLGQGFGGA